MMEIITAELWRKVIPDSSVQGHFRLERVAIANPSFFVVFCFFRGPWCQVVTVVVVVVVVVLETFGRAHVHVPGSGHAGFYVHRAEGKSGKG